MMGIHSGHRNNPRRSLRGLLFLVRAAVVLSSVLFISNGAYAQAIVESHIGSMDTRPELRTARMSEAWRIYEEYRATRDQIARLRSRIGVIIDDLQNTYAPGGMLGALAAATGGVGAELSAARAELERAEQRARELLAQWESNDLRYGDYFLGPLENAGEMVSVRHGPNRSEVTVIDRIGLGLIRWDQAMAAGLAIGNPATLDGRWHMQVGPHLAELIFSGQGGTIRYYHLPQEPITAVSYDPATGRVYFFRPTYPQNHSGTLTDRVIEGEVDGEGGYRSGFVATRVD